MKQLVKESRDHSQLDLVATATIGRLASAFALPKGAILPNAGDVSLGIEIEVPWSSYFPQLWTKHRFSEREYKTFAPEERVAVTAECDALEKDILPRLQRTKQALAIFLKAFRATNSAGRKNLKSLMREIAEGKIVPEAISARR